MVKNDWINLTQLKCVTCETHWMGYSMDLDCPRLAQSISTVFHRSISKPEVVVLSGFLCGRRDLSMDCDWSIPAIAHTKDRSGWTLPVYWRYSGKRMESVSHTSNIRIVPMSAVNIYIWLFSESTYCRLVHKHVPGYGVGQSNWVHLVQLSA